MTATHSSTAGAKRRKMPQQQRSRATRDRILESTIACLAESGWQQTTTSMVADRTGISRGALQHHFPTREDLFLTAVDYMFEAHYQADLSGAGELPEGVDGFDFIVESVLDYYTSDTFRAALHVWMAGAAEPALKERIRPLEEKFARGIYEQVVGLLNADVSDERTRRLIQTTLDLARGLGLADILSDDSARRKKISRFWAGELRSIKRVTGTGDAADGTSAGISTNAPNADQTSADDNTADS